MSQNNEHNGKSKFECCKTKIIKRYVYLTCGKAFHKSCVTSNKGKDKIIDKNRLECIQSNFPMLIVKLNKTLIFALTPHHKSSKEKDIPKKP